MSEIAKTDGRDVDQTFDRWVEEELERGFVALSAQPVPPLARYKADSARSFGAGKGLSPTRWLAPLLAALLTAGGGTMVAAAATGAHPLEIPAAVGQQISSAVASCKEQLDSGQLEVGQCVSEFVAPHRDSRAAPARGGEHPSASPLPPRVEGAPARPEQVPGRPDGERGRGEAGRDGVPGNAGPDNRPGAAVSDAARSEPPGPGHGPAVSDTARGNGRGPDPEPPGRSLNGNPGPRGTEETPQLNRGRSDQAPGRQTPDDADSRRGGPQGEPKNEPGPAADPQAEQRGNSGTAADSQAGQRGNSGTAPGRNR
jgi:hypothetical protein